MIFAVARRKMYIEIIGMYESVHYVRKCASTLMRKKYQKKHELWNQTVYSTLMFIISSVVGR